MTKTAMGRFFTAVAANFMLIQVLGASACQEAKAVAPPVIFITASPTPDPDAYLKITANIPAVQVEPDPDGVNFTGVTFATNGDFIIVGYKAPPEVVNEWWQGSVYIIDEATGKTYREVPVMPVVGPLIAKPKEIGQLGYFMLINPFQEIKPGSILTVILGKYKREHVIVP